MLYQRDQQSNPNSETSGLSGREKSYDSQEYRNRFSYLYTLFDNYHRHVGLLENYTESGRLQKLQSEATFLREAGNNGSKTIFHRLIRLMLEEEEAMRLLGGMA